MRLDEPADVVVRLDTGERHFTTLRQGLLYVWDNTGDVLSLTCNGKPLHVGEETWKR